VPPLLGILGQRVDNEEYMILGTPYKTLFEWHSRFAWSPVELTVGESAGAKVWLERYAIRAVKNSPLHEPGRYGWETRTIREWTLEKLNPPPTKSPELPRDVVTGFSQWVTEAQTSRN
jgi:hypothetical protein